MKNLLIFIPLIFMSGHILNGQGIVLLYSEESFSNEVGPTEELTHVSSLNSILKSYTIDNYRQYIPSATLLNHPLVEKLLRYYIIEAENGIIQNIYDDLNKEDIKEIEHFELLEEPSTLQCNPISPCLSNDPVDAPWNLTRHDLMNVREAWCITRGDPNVSIAIIDVGFDNDAMTPGFQQHMDIMGKVVFF